MKAKRVRHLFGNFS
ncbi:unnamed protein product [Callosobruchus maculatus]|nr:unnamed protein product [Callosobruchus maculatus]